MCSHKNLRAVVYSVAGFLHVKGCKAQPEINLTHFSRSQMQHWTHAKTRRERFSLCNRIGLVRRKKRPYAFSCLDSCQRQIRKRWRHRPPTTTGTLEFLQISLVWFVWFCTFKYSPLVNWKKSIKKSEIKKVFSAQSKRFKKRFLRLSSSFIGGEPAPHSGLEYVQQRLYN